MNTQPDKQPATDQPQPTEPRANEPANQPATPDPYFIADLDATFAAARDLQRIRIIEQLQ